MNAFSLSGSPISLASSFPSPLTSPFHVDFGFFVAHHVFDKMILCSFPSIVKCHRSHLNNPHFNLRIFSSARQTQSNRTIPTADHLLNKHKFSPKTASKVSTVLPHLKDPEKADSVLSFLKESGFSKTQLEKVVESNPKVLCSELESTIKPTINIFQDSGFSQTDVAEFISAQPRILNRSAETNNQLKRSLLVLREVLGSDLSVSYLIKYRLFRHCNLEKILLPNVEFLQSCGINSSQMKLALRLYVMYYKPETLKQIAKRVDEMGVSRQSKMFVYALSAVSSMTAENWERKLDLFRSIGFSEDEIVSVFRRVPNVFASSERKIKEMAEVLLNSGVYDFSFIVNYPQIFIYSIEGTIKPRLQVLKILKRKNLLIMKTNATVYSMSEKKFIDRYVLPFVDRARELLGMVNDAKNQLKVAEGSVEA